MAAIRFLHELLPHQVNNPANAQQKGAVAIINITHTVKTPVRPPVVETEATVALGVQI